MQIIEQYFNELKNDLEKINFHKINPIGKINNNDELKIKSKNLEEKIKYDDLMKHWSKVSSEIKNLEIIQFVLKKKKSHIWIEAILYCLNLF